MVGEHRHYTHLPPLGGEMECKVVTTGNRLAKNKTAPLGFSSDRATDRSHPCGERASLAVVPRLIVLPQEADCKPLGPDSHFLLLGCTSRGCCKSPNIRQVLLNLILGPASHLFLQQALYLLLFSPIARRQGHSPNVSWLLQFDPAVQQVLRIDIDNPSRSTLVRQIDMNRDSKAQAQFDCGCDHCTVKADDDGLPIAGLTLSTTLNSDCHL